VAIVVGLTGLGAMAQEPQDMGHGHAIIDKAIELFEQADTVKAMELLGTVHRSDSLYERALLIHLQIATAKNDLALSERLANTGIAFNGTQKGSFMVTRAAVLYDQGRHDACIAAADSAIAVLPGLFRPYHLKALALSKQDDKVTALHQIMENARRFPYQRESHILICSYAAGEDDVALGALAGTMAMVVRFDDALAENMLTFVDALLGGTMELKTGGYDLITDPDDEEKLEDLDQLIRSRVAMDKKYKLSPDLSYPICRQSHLLFSQVADATFEAGSPAEFYAALVREIMAKDLFEGYIYHCLASSNKADVRAMALKNKSKVLAFREQISEFIGSHYASFADAENGPALHHTFNTDGDLYAEGLLSADATARVGEWTFYHANGRPFSQGRFNEKGNKEGTWYNWYENGTVRSIADYVDDVLEGPFVNYHANGNMQDSCVMRKGLRQGPACGYYPAGGPSSCKMAKDDLWNGPVADHYPCGAISWSYTLVNEKLEGPIKQLHPDGSVQFEGTYTNDLRTGTFTEYHPNGKKADEYSFVAGALDGPFTEWHSNGKEKQKGTMQKGRVFGERTEYDAWGTLQTRSQFDEQGRLHGLQQEMDAHGHVYMETEYTRGLLTRYVYKDRSGKVLGEGMRSKGKFDLVGYLSDGSKRVEGTYLDEGAKDGVWKYFYPDGTLESHENYEKGVQKGEQLYYAEDGTLRSRNLIYDRDGVSYKRFERYYNSGRTHESGQRKGEDLEGVYTKYAPDGTVLTVEYYVEGEREGWQEYRDADGDVMYTERIQNGAVAERTDHDEDGVMIKHTVVPAGSFHLISHYPGGGVLTDIELMNGVRHGPSMWYYPDGSVEVAGGYLNGLRHGAWKTYHPNGKKHMEQTFHLGKLNGESLEWRDDGTKDSEFHYVDGLLEGSMQDLYANGKPAFIREYSNDELHGRHVSHDHAGNVQLVRFYHKGSLVGYGKRGADGSVTDTIPLGAGLAHIEATFPDGKPSRNMTYRNAELHGEFIEYHANGRVMEQATYRAGTVEGERRSYHSNGQLQSTTPHVDGLMHGEHVVMDENGKVRERITYKHGLKHGPWVKYDSNGRVLVTYRMRSNDVVEIIK
jgi:antitoxin component YwqK of YwqJK toxin-antitoxin module